MLSFVFLSPISLLVTAEKALAQSPFEINNTNAEPVDITNDPINGGGFEVNNTGVTGTDLNQIPNIQNQTQRQPEGLIKNNTVTKNTGGWEQTIGNAILQIAAYITYFGGSILEIAIEKLVFGMGTLLKDGIGNSIDSIWTIIRDISNLAFIFGFIYVGIRTIINPDSADTKRFLAQIIIGALLINFSLFFTKIVIDFSNYSAVQIYNTMINNPDGNISYAFAQKLGVTGLYAPPSTPDRLAAVTGAGHLWFYVMGAIMLVVAGFVLAAGGILLIVRFVALIFIMMFSPILFAATIFPQTEEYATDLWAKLISYSFFAPVYLLLLIASLKVLEGATNALGIGATATVAEGILSGKSDSYGVILNFVIVIMFLIFSLQVAQKMGVKGGEMAVSAGKNLRQRGQRALGASTAGLAAGVGRASIGKISNRISEKEGLKDVAAQKGVRGFMARQALKGSRAVGDASFDARNVAGVGKTLGIGEGRKGGYTTVKKEVQEKEEKFAKSLGEIDEEDVRVQARKKEMQGKEKELRGLEEELKALNPQSATYAQDRKNKREEIENKKKNIEEAKIQYESEKQRRIIGSTYANEDRSPAIQQQVWNKEQAITAKKNEIKKKWEGDPLNGVLAYADPYLSNMDKKVRREEITRLNEELKNLKKDQRKFLNAQKDQGYASVLESSNVITAWPVGRMPILEKEAGKAIRKTAEKGLPKKKDD